MSNITGAFPPPPGKVPNFDNPTDTGTRKEFIVWMIVPYIFTLGFCAVRTYVKASRCEMLPDDCKLSGGARHAPRTKRILRLILGLFFWY